jgi:hypothetical protein
MPKNFAFTSHLIAGVLHGATKITLVTSKYYKDAHYAFLSNQFLSLLNSGLAGR